ncbi:dihydrolipoamide succinyltransferase [Leucogyrophana mollusca]|uniref:Dihydrolipoamide succinyltransferase n=1 Tax=Leucogyrophana mollusca TaxID=85980 RepID=A0ACB8BUS5_9AGAM|nr:dihydrolipoamide succinyltransferase [Leucogyrophana mollusca]
MLSKQVIAAARSRAFFAGRQGQRAAVTLSKGWSMADSQMKRAQFHSSHLLQAETVKVPQMAESISEGTLRSWSKQVGDSVEVDEEVATIETDKIDVTVNAPTAGKIVELLAKEDDTVVVGQDLFRIEAGEGGATSSTSPQKQETAEEPKELSGENKTKDPEEPKDQQVEKKTPEPPSPSSADKKSGGIPPEGPKETKKDLKKEDKSQSKPSPAPKAPGSRNETRVKMNRMRLRIAERLKESQNAAASLTTFNEIDMSSLMDLRKKYKDEVLKEHDVKLGFMSAFARACTLALKEIPAANASIEGDEIVYRDYVDLSVAVATPKGLVTPVVRNAEGMGFIEIEKEIAALGKKARDGKLTLEDMSGGSFTISNGGVFGSLYGTPIINLPQAAVLGMHAIKEKPVVVNGQIVIRPIMVVALTYDHRLLDGREAVTFLVKVRDYIEDPRKMLLAPN